MIEAPGRVRRSTQRVAGAVRAVAAHELGLLARSLRGWLFLACFLLLGGLFFVVGLEATGDASLRPTAGGLVLALALFVPVLTARSAMAEISPIASVLGRWVAAVAWCTVLVGLTAAWAAVLVAFGHPAPSVLATGWLGLWLCAAAFCAAGVFAWAATSEPRRAWLTGVLTLLPWWLTGWAPARLEALARGVLDLGDVAWFAGFTAVFLLLAVRSRQPRTADAVASAVLAVATVVVLVDLAGTVAPRLDRTSLSTETRAVLDEAAALGVRYDITGFTAMHTDGDAWQRDHAVGDLLRDLDAHPNVDARLVDLDADRVTAEALGVRTHGTVVVRARDERTDLHPRELFAPDPEGGLLFAGEPAVRGAMARLLADDPRVLVLLVGHGERRPDDTAHGVSGLVALVRGRGWSARVVDLLDDGALADVPADADVVALIGPTEVLTPDEEDALQRWLARGGPVLLAMDPDGALPTSVEAGGITVPTGVVHDAVSVYPGRDAPLLAWRRHPITAGLHDEGARPLMTGCAPVVPVPGADAAVLLETSRDGWVERGEDGVFTAGIDTPGPVPVVVALRAGPARIVVAGDADWLTDAAIDAPANAALAVSALRWLAGDEVPAGPAGGGRLARVALSPPQLWAVRLGLLGGLPLLALLGATAVRRRP